MKEKCCKIWYNINNMTIFIDEIKRNAYLYALINKSTKQII